MKTKYTVDYFIKKFKRIPTNKWTTGHYAKHGRYCALGYAGYRESENGDIKTVEGAALYNLFLTCNLLVDEVNDGNDERYMQLSIKARVLAALRDIKNGSVLYCAD